MLKLKNITSYYVALQILGLGLAVMPDEILQINRPLGFIFLYHLTGLLFFIMGYCLPAIRIKNVTYERSLNVSRAFMFFGIAVCIFGILVSYLQLTSFFNISEYVSMFLSNDPQTREARGLGAHSEDGGIGGVFKMFAYAPLGVYLTTASWRHFYIPQNNLSPKDEVNKKRLNFLVTFSLLLSLFKAIFWLDRLTLGAIVLANAYTFFNKKKTKKTVLIYSVLFIAVVGLANAVSANRIEGYNLFDFLILYFKLGLVNFDLMVRTLHGHTYGFNSVFSPLFFVLKFIGIKVDFPATYDTEWNDAQYMNSYLHLDFGYFSLVVYFLIGWLMKNADHFVQKKNGAYISIYLMALFGLTTFWVVPITNAVEFWLMIAIAIMSSHFCVKKKVVTAS